MAIKKPLLARKIMAHLALCTFTFHQTVAFAGTAADPNAQAGQRPTVNQVNNVTVVDIAKPNEKGLSHNKYDQFNLSKNGMVLNNATGTTQTTLAGTVQANANLQGSSASLILNEVTGIGRTHLNGTLEIAGAKAAVVIANPNGITVNGFGAINADRVSLVTGRPNIDTDGSLNSFDVTGGDIQIQGDGIQEDRPASKLDLMTRAAQINAALWAEEINLITGANQINYQTLQATPIQSDAAKPAVALDVGALGGMYAGKIKLIGTEKGLGVTLDGDIAASQSLILTNDGRITLNGSLSAQEDIDITAQGDFSNDGQISSQQNIRIAARQITGSGFFNAGEEGEEDHEGHDHGDEEESGGSTPILADLTLTAAETVDLTGVLSASRNVILSGKTVTYDADNTFAQNVQVHQSDPNPVTEPEDSNPGEQPPQPAEPPTGEQPSTPDPSVIQPELPDLPDLPDSTFTPAPVAKPDHLPLVADTTAPVAYQPIIDRAANGVALVQIATPTAGGVSRNLYTHFNIDPSGLILNNTTEYTQTQLGGYIDANHRLNGVSAQTILSEVTSPHLSHLNGYLEIAGAQANLVIANANGISVNGFGTINAREITLSTAQPTDWQKSLTFASAATGDIRVEGDGLNVGAATHLQLRTRDFSNTASELRAQELTLTADGKLANSGAISASGNARLSGKTFTNTANGLIASGKDLTLTIQEDIHNQTATFKSGGQLTLTGQNLTNHQNALIYSGGNINLSLTQDLTNQTATIAAAGQSQINAAAFANTANALLYSGSDLTLSADHSQNQTATLKSGGLTRISGQTFTNRQGAYLLSEKDLTIHAAEHFLNQGSSLNSQGTLAVTTQEAINQDGAALISTGDLTIQAGACLLNQDSAMAGSGVMTVTAGQFANQNQALLSAGKALNLTIDQGILNEDSTVESNGPMTIRSQVFTNDKGYWGSGGALDLTVTNALTNQDALLAANGTALIHAGDIYNLDNAILYSTGGLTLAADNHLLNQSAGIQSQGSIHITARQFTNEKTVFETGWTTRNENHSMAIDPLPEENYYSATRKFTREIKTGAILQETAAAQVLAGKDITIDAAVVNRYSTIAAGGDLTIKGPSLENYGYQGTRITTDVGTDTHRYKWRKHRKFHHNCTWRYGTTPIDYTPPATVENTESTRKGIVSAGGKVSIQSGTEKNITLDADKKAIQNQPKTTLDPAITNPLAGYTTIGVQVSAAAVTIDALAVNAALYEIKEDPSAKYLIETREQFSRYQDFLSSDYLLERVKTDPEKVAKRLGDGCYEQKLVTEQIIALTGQQYSSDYTSELEQYKALMDNAATFAQEYDLTIGVALTEEQMAALTSDIVWLVEEVIHGQTVLVPQVYLSQLREGDLTPGGAIIAGHDVEIINGDSLQNIGTIKADQNLTVNTDSITNQFGLITGGEVNLTADDTLANISGLISGDNVTITAGSILNQTATQTDSYQKETSPTLSNLPGRFGLASPKQEPSGKQELEQTYLLDTAGITATGNLSLTATSGSILNQGAVLGAGKDLTITAAQDIDIESVSQERRVAVAYQGSSYSEHLKIHQGSQLSGENIILTGKNQVNIQGAALAAEKTIDIQGDNGVAITADKDIYQTDSTVGSRGGSYFNHHQENHEAVKGTDMDAGQTIDIKSKNKDILIKGSDITSETGTITLDAKENVTIANETEQHETLRETHEENFDGLTKITTDTYQHQKLDAVAGSDLSGSTLVIKAGDDVTIQASKAVADEDVTITGDNVTIQSAEENSWNEYMESIKKSGFSLSFDGGLNVFAGTAKTKSTEDTASVEQKKSTIGSVNGHVNITAENDVKVSASEIIAKEGIDITGQNVAIEAGNNTTDSHQTFEFKQTGLTVTVGNSVVSATTQAVNSVDRAAQVEDDRLAALHGIKAIETGDKAWQKAHGTDPDTQEKIDPKKVNVSVSIGSSKQESESHTHISTSVGSSLKSEQQINIIARGSGEKDAAGKPQNGDIDIIGSSVNGKDILLDAANNVNLESAANTVDSSSKSSQKSASVGVDLTQGGVTLSGQHGKGNTDEHSLSYNQTTITAEQKLTVKSGNDTNLAGAQAKGDTAEIDVKGDLNLASQQDRETYTEKNESVGGSIGIGAGASVNLSANTGKMDSDYQSVNEQTGIFAGKGGFDVKVVGNTDLKGAVIGSETDQNKLSTGTLTWSDIENKAEYESNSVGVNVNTKPDAELNEKGITPDMGVPASGDESSTTKAAIAQGTIEIKDQANQKADITQLSRDTENALNKLDQIFDKKTVQEKQELAKMFGEEAFKAVGDLAAAEYKKALEDKISAKDSAAKAEAEARIQAWGEGGLYKVALHSAIGSIMADMGGGNALSGGIGAGVNEMVQGELSKRFAGKPDLHQWASLVVGGAAAKMVGGDAQTGGTTAASGTKNNRLTHMQEDYIEDTKALERVSKRQDVLDGITDVPGEEGTAEKTPALTPEAMAKDSSYSPEVQHELQERAAMLEIADSAYVSGLITLDERNILAIRFNDEATAIRDKADSAGINTALNVGAVLIKNTPAFTVADNAINPSPLGRGDASDAILDKLFEDEENVKAIANMVVLREREDSVAIGDAPIGSNDMSDMVYVIAALRGKNGVTNAEKKVVNNIASKEANKVAQGTVNSLTNIQNRQIETLRNGGEVKVKTYEEARKLLDNMPELKPATEAGKLPNPDGRMRDGFADPKGTYRGDLINKQDPTGPVHPDVKNSDHANYPHYNIKLPNGDKATIIIVGGD